MSKNSTLFFLPLTVLGIMFTHALGMSVKSEITGADEKGAQVYCYLRRSGNDHEVSWQSAYEVIKRQSNGLFKTSPKHAAVMIIEAVVDEPEKYDNCGQFLGDLFKPSQSYGNEIELKSTNNKKLVNEKDRYSY